MRGLRSLPRALAYLRLRPFETDTEQGRARERYRRMALTMTSTLAARAAQVGVTVTVVRLTLAYLGAERYGLWMTISSLATLLSHLAQGVGNGLVQAISEAHGRGDRDEARSVVSTGHVLIGGLALSGVALVALAWPFVSWPALFNVHGPEAVSEAGPAVAVLIVAFAVNMVINVISRVQLGHQESYINQAWQAVGTTLTLPAALAVIHAEGGLPLLVLALVTVPALTNIANAFIYYRRTRPYLAPRPSAVSRDVAKRLLRLGGSFFVLQMLFAGMVASDNFIAAAILGADAVTDFAVPQKLFNILQVLFMMLVQAFWPAYGEAIARGDVSWVRRALRRGIALALLLGVGFSVVLVGLGRPLVELWVAGAVQPSYVLLGGLAAWGVAYALGQALTPLLHGAGAMRPQVIWMALALVVSLVAKVLLVRAMGVDGLPWGMLAGYGACYLVPAALYMPRLLRRLEARAPSSTTS